MKRILRKTLAALLTLALLLPLFPAPALAADPTGEFSVDGGEYGTTHSFSGGKLTIKDGAKLTISTPDKTENEATWHTIKVADDATVEITLDTVHIRSDLIPLELGSGAKASITLQGENTLVSDAAGPACL